MGGSLIWGLFCCSEAGVDESGAAGKRSPPTTSGRSEGATTNDGGFILSLLFVFFLPQAEEVDRSEAVCKSSSPTAADSGESAMIGGGFLLSSVVLIISCSEAEEIETGAALESTLPTAVVPCNADDVTGGDSGFLRQVSCPKAGMVGIGVVGISRPNTNVVGAHL